MSDYKIIKMMFLKFLNQIYYWQTFSLANNNEFNVTIVNYFCLILYLLFVRKKIIFLVEYNKNLFEN